MKKLIWVVAIVVALIIILSVVSKKNTNNEAVKIGALYTLSGPIASYGEFQKRAAEFAVKQVNDAGGIDGKPVELYVEDTASDAKKGVNAYNALKLKGIKYYIVEYSPVAAAVRLLAISDGNLLMTAGATTPAYVDGNGLTCRTTMTAKDIGPALAERLISKNLTRISYLVPNNEYGKGVADEFKKAIEAKGGKIAVGEFYDASGVADFRTNLAKIKAEMKNTDALVAVNAANTVEALFQQIADSGWSKPIFSDYNTIPNPALKNRTVANGVEYVDWNYQSTLDSTDSAVTREFKEKYKAQFKDDPIVAVAGYYDGVNLILSALKSGAKNPIEASAYLKSLNNYDVVLGKIKSFDEDCQASRDYTFRKVEKGEFIKAE